MFVLLLLLGGCFSPEFSSPTPRAEPHFEEDSSPTASLETPEATTGAEPDPTPTSEPLATEKEEAPVVKIALLEALQLDVGQEMRNWVNLAIEDYNAATGWNVELVEVDTGLDATTIPAEMDAIISDQAIYVALGPQRYAQILAAMTISDLVGLPHLVFNGYPGLQHAGMFRLVPTDDLQGATAAHFLLETLGVQTVFVLVQAGQGSSGSYGYELYTAFEQAFHSGGGQITARYPVAPDEENFGTLAAEIQATGAEAVFAADTSAAQGILIASALRDAGLEIPLLGHYGWAEGLFAASAEGAYVLSPVPAVVESALAQRYMEQFGTFGVYGPLAYTATMTALEAIQRAAESGSLSRASVQRELAATNQSNTILGWPIAFTRDGNLQNAQFTVLKVENGAFK